MKKLTFAPTLVLAAFFLSCAHKPAFVKSSYDILSVSKTSYDTSMKVVADLDSRGLLTQAEKDEILKAANIYYETHNTATEALARYEETGDLSDKERLEEQLLSAGEALTDLLMIIQPYLGR